MVDDYYSDAEQFERAKAWLWANVPWILGGIAVGGLAIFGWRWWQGHTDQLALEAGAEYQQVLQAFNSGNAAHAFSLISDLERNHAGSPYTDQANLAAARVLVETNQLESGAQHLETVARHSRDPELATIAKLRLARVQISLGKPDEALATLGPLPSGAFAARYHEVRGDAYFAKGEKAAALDEYRAARLAAGPALAENDVLNLKINDLTGAVNGPVHRKETVPPNAPASGAHDASGGAR